MYTCEQSRLQIVSVSVRGAHELYTELVFVVIM